MRKCYIDGELLRNRSSTSRDNARWTRDEVGHRAWPRWGFIKADPSIPLPPNVQASASWTIYTYAIISLHHLFHSCPNPYVSLYAHQELGEDHGRIIWTAALQANRYCCEFKYCIEATLTSR